MRHISSRSLTFCLLAALVAAASGVPGARATAAPAQAEPPTMAEAGALFEQQRWAEAVEAYTAIVEHEPDNGRAWFNRAYALHADGQLAKAIEAHRKAARFDDFRGIATYNLGCAYALSGRTDDAFEALRQASEAGFRLRGTIEHDADLDSLRQDPRYEILLHMEPPVLQERVMSIVGRVRGFFQRKAPGLVQQAQQVAQAVMMRAQEVLGQFRRRFGGAGSDGNGGPFRDLEAFTPPDRPVDPRGVTGRPEADVSAGRSEPAPSMMEIGLLLQTEEFGAAARALERVVAAQPENGQAWFLYGFALHADGQLERAIETHKKAATFDEFRGTALYNLGCAYALSGRPDDAFKALGRSIDAGFDVAGSMEDDPDFDSIRDDPRYRAILEGDDLGDAAGEVLSFSAELPF